jgi:hypothetical protein
MRRMLMAVFAALALAIAFTAPVGAAREFDTLYAEGETFRTFGNPARVDPGTGTDPIYAFTNSTNSAQLSVARYAPGEGSHGGRWAVRTATWVNAADADTLITSADQVDMYEDLGLLIIDRVEEADFRCPILPNG